MSWEQFDAEGGGAAYVKLNIGDTFTGTVLRLVKFFDKTWPGGSVERCVEFEVVDAADGATKTLDVSVRRASPLNRHRADLESRGLHLDQRVTKIECYAENHPTRPGARIGCWRCSDAGPRQQDRGDQLTAIDAANDLDALKAAFSAAWKSTEDELARQDMRQVYEARKRQLENGEGVANHDVPF